MEIIRRRKGVREIGLWKDWRCEGEERRCCDEGEGGSVMEIDSERKGRW